MFRSSGHHRDRRCPVLSGTSPPLLSVLYSLAVDPASSALASLCSPVAARSLLPCPACGGFFQTCRRSHRRCANSDRSSSITDSGRLYSYFACPGHSRNSCLTHNDHHLWRSDFARTVRHITPDRPILPPVAKWGQKCKNGVRP